MIPENRLSTVPVLGYFLPPDDREPSRVVDYEMGGIGLNDPTQGYDVQVWVLSLKNIIGTNEYGLYIEAPNTPETFLFSATNVIDVSLAFDQNMRPAVAFVEDGRAKIWWYDTAVASQVFTNLPVDAGPPKCCLDDKRITQTNTSDIIVVYVRSGNLYYQQQRDRFTVEYLLKSAVTGQMLIVGMSTVNRLQFMLGDLPDVATVYNGRLTTSGDLRTTTAGNRRRIVGASYA